ncbi:MAG: hypothetical protein ACK4YP_03225 [Myxococcota bacterium]
MKRVAHPLGVALLVVGAALSVATSPPPVALVQTQTATREGAFEVADGETAEVAFRVEVSCAHPDAEPMYFPAQVVLLEDVDVLSAEGGDSGVTGQLVATVYADGVELFGADATIGPEEASLPLGLDLGGWCAGVDRCTVDLTWVFEARGADAAVDWRAFVGAAWAGEEGGACLVFFSEREAR